MPPFPLLEEKPGVATEQTCYPRRPKDRKGKETMERFIFGVLLVVALSLSGTGADPQCPATWSFYKGHCYKAFYEFENWDYAERFCRQERQGAHLASIHSDEERDFVANEVYRKASFRYNAWIGLWAPRNPPVWRWTDNSPFQYEAWAPGEPNNSDSSEYCISLTKQSRFHQWQHQKCDLHRNFICKFYP